MSEVVQQFYAAAGMPNVVGCIDGTLIKIDAPVENEECFVDRHGNHSINCMLVCGPDLKFYYLSAKWPGKVHDSRVLRNSTLYTTMEGGWRPYARSILLDDSAYGCSDWLITPQRRDLENVAVQRFNRAHKSTRRIIENAIGVLKEKFPCLNYLRINPIFACNIIKVCVTLCNISSGNAINESPLNDEDSENENDSNSLTDTSAGISRRQELINTFAQ